MEINISVLYGILRNVARQGEEKGQITYKEVSEEYQNLTGDWHEPHGSWSEPLGQINNILSSGGLPPLSAVVVLGNTRFPGNSFWGSAPNVRDKPQEEADIEQAYLKIWREVLSADWPEALP
jgi:hypothetical protein